MGAAASVQTAEQQQLHGDRLKHHKPEPVSSSMRSYNRGSVRGSVRQMALMNHSRQENSYISADKLSAQFSAHPKKDSDQKPAPQRKFRDHKPAETSISDHKVVAPAMKIEEMVQEEPENKQSLSTFRSNFNLKLNLGLESQEEENNSDDENDEKKFGTRLIAIPSEENAGMGMGIGALAIPPPLSSPVKVKEGDMQTDANGDLFVDGLNVGVGAQGLIRPDRSSESRSHKLPMRERLLFLCKLGAGASSAVYKALDLQEMRLVALKTIQVYDKDKRVQMIRELSALFQLIKENSRRESTMNRQKLLRRPEKYIVDFYDAFSNLEDGVVCLMIEYMDGGSLQDIVDQGGCDDEAALANISIQALKGLGFLHGNLQLHRDLKPANFLISHRGEVKVADLGIMKQLPPPRPGNLSRTNTFVGTASYMSPERIDGKDYSLPADIWAFGLTLITLALGRLPIDTQGGYWTILNGIRDAPAPSLPDAYSPEFRDFISLCMKKKPEERATCNDLLKHRFLMKAIPDDLTIDQSLERGKKELLSIVQVLITHLTLLQEDYRNKYSSEDEYKDQVPIGHERAFGNLYSSTIPMLLRKLLLPEEDPRMVRRKPRLGVLARQLHLPLDKAQSELRDFIEGLEQGRGAAIREEVEES